MGPTGGNSWDERIGLGNRVSLSLSRSWGEAIRSWRGMRRTKSNDDHAHTHSLSLFVSKCASLTVSATRLVAAGPTSGPTAGATADVRRICVAAESDIRGYVPSALGEDQERRGGPGQQGGQRRRSTQGGSRGEDGQQAAAQC